jgi:chromate transporter
VILNLALFFSWHVFWPQGFSGNFDAVSAVISIVAFLALMRYKVSVIPLIVACGVTGLLLNFIKIWLNQQGVTL